MTYEYLTQVAIEITIHNMVPWFAPATSATISHLEASIYDFMRAAQNSGIVFLFAIDKKSEGLLTMDIYYNLESDPMTRRRMTIRI